MYMTESVCMCVCVTKGVKSFWSINIVKLIYSRYVHNSEPTLMYLFMCEFVCMYVCIYILYINYVAYL